MQIPDSNATPLDHEPDASVDEVVADVAEPSTGEGPRDVPTPIGPERLRQLREAIENGTYPNDEDVTRGLDQLFTRP